MRGAEHCGGFNQYGTLSPLAGNRCLIPGQPQGCDDQPVPSSCSSTRVISARPLAFDEAQGAANPDAAPGGVGLPPGCSGAQWPGRRSDSDQPPRLIPPPGVLKDRALLKARCKMRSGAIVNCARVSRVLPAGPEGSVRVGPGFRQASPAP